MSEINTVIMDTPTLEHKTSADTLMTMHFMQEMKADVDNEHFEKARKTLYALGIKTSFDESRVIFTTMQTHKHQLTNIYAQECNGLILEKNTWRP